MKNPHVLLADGWNKTVNGSNKVVGDRDQLLVSVSSGTTAATTTKKFKRKSREPKRLYSSPGDPVGMMKPFRGGDLTADEDSAGESSLREERCSVNRLAMVQRRLLMPSQQDLVPPSSSGSLAEDRRAIMTSPAGQGGGGAIDMRIGTVVPAITARLAQQQQQLPVPQSPNVHPSHRPSSLLLLSQPDGHKLGLVSPTFPSLPPAAATSSSSSHHHHHHHHHHHEHPSIHQPHHPYALQDGPLSGGRLGGLQQQGQTRGERARALSGASHTLCSEYDDDDDEPQSDSPQDSPRKRGMGGGGGLGGFGEPSPPGRMGGGGVGGFGEPSPPGRVPEIKALQQTRRLLANARERTRVHTISAAFEALRKQVPCYSYGQKLSKLAILRIACNYILSLAQLAELDYSPSEHSSLSFSQCVEQCTRTLQAEGRSKKRKE